MDLSFRTAVVDDLRHLVRLLSDDFLGAIREDASDLGPYFTAFREIGNDRNNEIIVVENERHLVGMLQLTFSQSLSFRGGTRATVESVRVDARYRAAGIGHKLMEHAIDLARKRGCIPLQLTTNSERTDAHRFYERLGFTASDVGMKLKL